MFEHITSMEVPGVITAILILVLFGILCYGCSLKVGEDKINKEKTKYNELVNNYLAEDKVEMDCDKLNNYIVKIIKKSQEIIGLQGTLQSKILWFSITILIINIIVIYVTFVYGR